MRDKQVDPAVRDRIVAVVQDRLAQHGLRDVLIEPGSDQDGDPVLFVTAHFDLVAEPIDPAITFDLTGPVREALAEMGETRYPHIRFEFHEDQKITPRKKRRRA